jgi:hypothetical protein
MSRKMQRSDFKVPNVDWESTLDLLDRVCSFKTCAYPSIDLTVLLLLGLDRRGGPKRRGSDFTEVGCLHIAICNIKLIQKLGVKQ